MRILILALILSLLTSSVYATETCSRIAIINYQEILVDTTSTQKGEGLRYHLEKDPIAKSHLDSYQKGTQIQWTNAAIGTFGSLMILVGLLTNSDNDKKRTFMISGATLIATNFLVARTMEYNNGANLLRAVEEYNKRNLPRIYFPVKEGPDGNGLKPGIGVEKSWSF